MTADRPSPFEPSRPEGATFHTCEECGGEGYIGDDECLACSGTGEWFE